MDFFEWALQFMISGGVFMWVILMIWCTGIGIAIERWAKYISYNTNGKKLLIFIRKSILTNQIPEAIIKCNSSSSLLSNVMGSGLTRFNYPKDEIQTVLQGSILEVVPKISRRINTLAITANLSTLLGLLGTIQGLIQSFAAVAQAEASQKAQLLADGIAVAMNTTALGLISAITIMVAHSILMSKGEKMIQEIEENSAKLLDLLIITNTDNIQEKAS